MKSIFVKHLIPGMIIAKDVYTQTNILLLSKGTIITDKVITTLIFHNIIKVCIYKESVATPHLQENHTNNDYFSKIRASEEFIHFHADFEKTVDGFKQSINDIVEKNSPIDVTSLYLETTKHLVHDFKNYNVFDMLHNMRSYDDSTYVHCVNVALICNIFGNWLNLSEEQIKALTVAGLLHDIGKLEIPNEIITKPGKLTRAEYEIVKTHTTRGYEILKQTHVDPRILNSALMHHERYDGSGYPLGLLGPQTEEFAKIVAIADVYDAMTSARVYRGPMCPFKAIRKLEEDGIQKYEPRYILTFLEHIVTTYLHTEVLLSNGMKATVVFINKTNLGKPIVKVGNMCIDLSINYEIEIESIL